MDRKPERMTLVRVCYLICFIFWTTDAQNIGMIAGAVCGVVVGLCLLFLVVRLTIRRKEKKRYEEEEAPNEIR